MDFKGWIKGLLKPSESNLEGGSIDEIHAALNDQAVRKYWIKGLEDELWQLNVKIDRLMEEESDYEWRRLSFRRNAIIFCLQKVLDAKHLLESEREAQDHENRIFESYRGVAATLNLDDRADNRASDPQRG